MNTRLRMMAVLIVLASASASACGRSRGLSKNNGPAADGGPDAGLDGGSSVAAGSGGDGGAAGSPDGGDVVVPPGPAVCGNGRLEDGEQCDGAVGRSCADLGFGGGDLTCSSRCLFDASRCSERPRCELRTSIEVPPVCADVLCACDAATFSQCDTACQRYIQCALNACGVDGIAGECPMRACGESPELRAAHNLLTCVAGNPLCSVARPPSRCGNDLAERGELCDGFDLRGQSCGTIGRGEGQLACTADTCEFDPSGCSVGTGVCGNGEIEFGEACDGAALAGESCRTLGYRSGELRCNGVCGFDTNACEQCGNTRVESGEECDGANLNGQTCVTLGYSGGVLRCDQGCRLDDAACARCGDGEVGAGENCDGEELQGASCESLGLGTGTLACSPGTCHYDTQDCHDGSSCGDGVAGVDEQCDGMDLASQDCTSLGLGGGDLRCNEATCRYDSRGCMRDGDCVDGCLATACENVLKICDETPGCQEVRVCLDGCRMSPIPSCTMACTGDPNVLTPAVVASDCVSDCFQACR